MSTQQIIVMAKPPQLGKVKTRLAASIGEKVALKLYEEMLSKLHDTLLPHAQQVRVYWGFSSNTIPQWPFKSYLQVEGDLGARMNAAFTHTFAATEGIEQVIMIGTDCPGFTEAHMQGAFDALTHHEVVLGPAEDGGFYLVGLRKPFPALFLNKSWSHNRVLEEAIRTAEQHRMHSALLPTLSDLDTKADLPKFPHLLNMAEALQKHP